MADGTKIEWTEATWNPITGCSVTSPGCTNCYAMQLAGTRLAHHPSREGLTRESGGRPKWTGEVRFNEGWLADPLRWKRARLIFVCAHGDLFHESVADAWIDRVFAVMALCPQHTFQVLTKRSARMREYFAGRSRPSSDALYDLLHGSLSAAADRAMQRAIDDLYPLSNVWLGVSIEDQQRADERIPDLLATPAAVRWLSCEPLLGPVDLRNVSRGNGISVDALTGYHSASLMGFVGEPVLETVARLPILPKQQGRIDWIVAGGESGPNARPMHPDWARSLRDQCAAAAVPFFFKQWGEWRLDLTGDPITFDTAKGRAQRTPAFIMKRDGTVHCFLPSDEPNAPVVLKVGKKRAGRLLDGVEHNGVPQHA
jgi:protein gp37